MFLFKIIWDSWNEQLQAIHKPGFNNDTWFLYNISPQWMGNDVQRNWQYTGGTSVKVRNGDVKSLLVSSLGAARGSRITESWKTGPNAQADGYWMCSVKVPAWRRRWGVWHLFSRSASALDYLASYILNHFFGSFSTWIWVEGFSLWYQVLMEIALSLQ